MSNQSRTRRPLRLHSASAVPRKANDPLLTYLARHRPQSIPEDKWERIQPFVTREISRLNIGIDEAARGLVRNLTYMSAWALDEGIALDVEEVLDPDLIERYCDGGYQGKGASTVRASLKRLGRALTSKAPWEPPPPAYPRTKLPDPFSTYDLERIDRDIDRQSTPIRCYSARVVRDLGLGAGLDGRWIFKLRGSDVAKHRDAVVVAVPAPAARLVVVRGAFADDILRYAKKAGRGPLLGRNTDNKNAWRIASEVVIDQGRIPFAPGRFRSSWIVAHLEAGTQLPVLLAAAGIQHLPSLRDLCRFVRRVSDAEACRQLRDA